MPFGADPFMSDACSSGMHDECNGINTLGSICDCEHHDPYEEEKEEAA